MESIPRSEQAQNVAVLDMNFEDLPIERVLGISWNVESDVFQFHLTLDSKPMTRRGILSTVASVYDPLGCLAPFTLIGKQILQTLCRENRSWDEPLSDSVRPRWERWIIELRQVGSIGIERCLLPKYFGTVILRELHHFSDASLTGYGQCSYLRLVNDREQVHYALVMGKGRVAPLKVTTVPRLELAAAVVSTKISVILRREMKYEMNEFFWTDSQVVLGYIRNDARRFHMFVANRIQQIQNKTTSAQWNYVRSEHNPADHASRGLYVEYLVASNWFHGPEQFGNFVRQRTQTKNSKQLRTRTTQK